MIYEHCNHCDSARAVGTMVALHRYPKSEAEHYCSKQCLIEAELKMLFYSMDPQPIMDLLKRTLEEDRQRFKTKYADDPSVKMS